MQFIKLSKSFPIKQISLNREPHEKYPGLGTMGLVNREKGNANFRSNQWMGFEGENLEILIEFEHPKKIKKVMASVLSNPGAWIFWPNVMLVRGSMDGVKYDILSLVSWPQTPKEAKSTFEYFKVEFPIRLVRYLKVELKHFDEI